MLVETTLVLLTLILGCLGPTTSFNRTNKLRGFSNAFHSLSVSPRLVAKAFFILSTTTQAPNETPLIKSI
ncbi:hypothetical protein BHE74_00000826 [Ensete ventricosum]|nr:hypothetical protein GW17_00045790 [Ensete ventricosum]RWW90036.1 hypothetical protein BHE74_00000826 [Ensete ventricosum]RZS23762.1 hypothetical protein BHM03_00056745 [Ensete ventricosum]